jgi:hypothetical protein
MINFQIIVIVAIIRLALSKEQIMIYELMCKSIALIIVTFQRQVTDNAILSALTAQLSLYVAL